ncbi:MAG: hypothetical protein AAGA56_31155, partial [Myxococcota bacterium]
STTIKLKQVSLKPLVRMLEKLRTAGHPIAISQIQIKARVSAPDLYDVALGVSAFDKKKSKKAEKKPGGAQK